MSIFNFFCDSLLGEEEVPERPACLLPHNDLLFFGLHNLPIKVACTHFAVIGNIGSGKTIAIRLFLQSLCPRFKTPRPQRLIVNDPKREMYSLLCGMGIPESRITLLNPFDSRSVAWDIARDINEPAHADYLAAILIQEEKSSSAPHFYKAARQIVSAVVRVLTDKHPGQWTLADLLRVLYSKERIRAVVQQIPEARLLAQGHLDDERHIGAIYSHLTTDIGRFAGIAALWEDRPKRSLTKDWSQGGGVLLLGDHPVYSETLAPLNALALQILADHFLAGDEGRSPHTFFVLDEFRWMKEVKCVPRLLNQGRSKGLSVLLGLQGIEGLQAEYTELVANEILAACSNKTFFCLGSNFSAKWAQEHFGEKEELEISYSERFPSSGQPREQSVNYSVNKRWLLIASQFMELPTPETHGLYAGINDIPNLGQAVYCEEDFATIQKMLLPPRPGVPNQLFRPSDDQRFSDWSGDEEQKFCGEIESSRHAQGEADEEENPLDTVKRYP